MEGSAGARPTSAATDEELARRLAVLDEKVDAAIDLIHRLREEKAAVESRLAESERLRREAAERLTALLDRIDTLL